jgi:hypothetical protein
MMPALIRHSICLYSAWLAIAVPAAGDEFVLRSGARLRGDWKNPGETGSRTFLIHTESGISLRVDSSQVVEHVREAAAITDYWQVAPTFADNVDEQWRLAEWCAQRGLEKERREHLRRVVELDPQQARAWQALGYHEIDGKWVTRQGYLEEQGLVYYRGRWRLPQEVHVMEERRKKETLEREWFARLKNLRQQAEVDKEKGSQIAAVRDPHALRALSSHLRRERSPGWRLLYVEAVAQIQDPRAIQLLIETALNDPDAEVFHACADHLSASQSSDITKSLTDALREPVNSRINRAAHLLARRGDQRMIPVLVEALVTTHYVANPAGGRTAYTMAQATGSSPFSTNGASAADAGSTAGLERGPRMVPVQVANQDVLAALVHLSGGESFGFDQRAWSNWWSLAARPSTSSAAAPARWGR